MLVRATSASSAIGVRIKELGRIAYEGEEFEVTDGRYLILSGQNKYRAVFVIKVYSNEEDIDNVNDIEESSSNTKSKRKRKVKEEPELEEVDYD